MLLKKTAVLLMGLAMIVAFACGTPAAKAAEFNVVLDTSGDIGAVDGLQLSYPANNTLQVVLFLDQAIALETSHLTISGYNASNVFDPAIVLATSYPVWPITASRSFRVSITVTPGTSRVSLRVEGGIPSADPTNADTSRELIADIGLLDTTREVAAPSPGVTPVTPTVTSTAPPVTPVTPAGAPGASTGSGPKVYNIRREPVSVLPLTGGAVTVIITLSEAAQGLSAAHINVTNATAGAPVHLGAVSQNTFGLGTVTTHLTTTGAIGVRPTLRTVDQLRDVIEDHMNDVSSVSGEFIDNVRPLIAAVDALGNSWRYYYLNSAGLLSYETLRQSGPPVVYKRFPLVAGVVPPPTTQGTADIPVTAPIVWTLLKVDFDRSAPRPLTPEGPPGNNAAEANFRQAKFKARTSSAANNQRAWYQKEKLAYDRYMIVQKALQAHDVRKQVEWDQQLAETAAPVTQVPQDSLPPTGRDNMLHRYSVTITPTYANSNPVVVKVNRFPNTSIPQLYYTPPVLESGYVEGFDKLTLQVSAGAVIVPPVVPEGTQVVELPEGFGFFFAGAPGSFTALEREQIQEQIDLLIATGDRSPEAMRALAYLQQLLATARPEKTQLLANYPNPFNPETWIPYELATDTHVTITIYNPQGVVIRTLQLGQQSAGYYVGRDRAAYWDGRNAVGEQVASGIYFYQFETDEMSVLRKMVILK